jgi:hypothetical protein
MGSPLSPQRRIVPPTVPPVGERKVVAYVPRKYEREGMDRSTRNLVVWLSCGAVIVVAVVAFVYFMLSDHSRGILNWLDKR